MDPTTEITNPTEPIEEDDTFRLSIDAPVAPQPAMQPDYDGAPASEAPEPAAEVTTPSGKKLLRIDMGNGKYFTAETERELLQKVVDAQKEASRYIEELKSRPAPAAASVTVTPRVPINYGDLPEKYDHQTYLNMLAEDPIKAQRYINREIYGDLDPVEALRHSYTISNQIQQEMLVAEFRRQNPDFQPDYAEPILKTLTEHNMLPNTVPNLEWAFNHLKKNGQIKSGSLSPEGEVEYEDINFGTPLQVPTVVPIQRQNQPQRRGANAPQAVRGGGTGGDMASPIDPWAVPLETLRDAIEKKGVRR